MHLNLLSAGAAKGLVAAMQPAFTAATGCQLHSTFSAVGAMKDQLLAGEPCDVVILTAALIDALARDGHVVSGTLAALGAALRGSLLASSGIYVPDTQRSTAGIHVMKVLRSLGIDADVAPWLRAFPN